MAQSYLLKNIIYPKQQSLRKQPKSKIRYLVFTILSIIGFHLIFIFYNKESIRITYYALVSAATYLSVYQIIFGKGKTILMRFIGSMYILFAAISLFRGIISLLPTASSGSLFTPGTYQMFFLLTIFIFSNFGSIGFILLKKEKVDQELLRFATYDDLTGTLNRRIFTDRATNYLNSYSKKDQPISYILFDIDNFKNINDTFGHHIGDEILKDLTLKITKQLNKDDLFGRYGGDEFGILLPGKNVAESTKIAEQIKQSLNEEINDSLPVTYTISIGIITIIPEHSTQMEMLYTNCDKALYNAKHNGRISIFRGQLEERHKVSS